MGNSVPDMLGWKNQARLSIVVTDSGLGGLSICAEMVNSLVDARRFRDLSVVYFNAWPMQDKGYNFLDDDAARIRVFGNAIRSINSYSPDLIFIACNTLSIIFQQGGLAADASAPVVDIINFGIDMIMETFDGDPQSVILVLGTRTTIASDVHRKQLIGRGIDATRIVSQDCHGLAGAIERDPQSYQVRTLVARFMAQAASAMPPGTERIYVALCCTHYGYSQALIKQNLSRCTRARIEIVNPNQAMGGFGTLESPSTRCQSVSLNIDVVSRVHLPAGKINAIAAMVEPVSPPTALALRNYLHHPDLFDV